MAWGKEGPPAAPTSRVIAAMRLTGSESNASMPLQLLHRGVVQLADGRPVDDVVKCGDVIGTPVLIQQVVSVLPHVDTENWRVPVHERAVLIGRAFHYQLLVLVDAQPGPTAAETARGRGAEGLLECVEPAELRLDRFGQLAGRLSAFARADRDPEH